MVTNKNSDSDSNFTPSDYGHRVFTLYGIDPDNKKNQKFRNEKTGSFSIHFDSTLNQYKFNDFGNDFKGVGFLKFLMLCENCTYKEAIIKARSIYNEFDYTISKPTTKKIVKEAKPNELAQIEFQKFSQSELDYWKEKGQVTLKTLQELNVKSVKSFSVFNPSTGNTKDYYTKGFVFAYEIVALKAYKLYMPKEQYRVFGTAKTAFLPNLSSAKEIDSEYSYSFGLDNLKDNSKDVILCEGEGDALALIEQGYNVFTVGSAVTSLSNFITAKLKAKNVKIGSILFDTDYTGLQASLKLSNNLNCSRIILPKLYKQLNKEAPKPLKNDFCDYINEYGFDSEIYATIESSFPLVIKKRLEEIEPQLKSIIKQNPFTSIQAPTGTGKTYTFINSILPTLFNHSIFAVPTVLQAKQIEKEYNIDTLHGNKTINEAYLNQDVLVCTYDKLASVYNAINAGCIVIDESHLLSDSYSYRSKAIKEISQCVRLCQANNTKVIYLSATPCNILESLHGESLTKFSVKRTDNPNVNILRYEYGKSLNNTLLAFLSDIDYSNGKIYLAKVDSYNIAQRTAKTLIELGLLKKDEIDFVFSEKTLQFKTETAKSIEDFSQIPSSKKLVFCSKILDIGTNLNNNNIELIYGASHREPTRDIIQFVARCRKMSNVTLNLFKKQDDRECLRLDSIREAITNLNLANAYCTLLNHSSKEPQYSQVLRNNSKLHKSESISYDSHTKKYAPNLQAIASEVNIQETQSLSNKQYYHSLNEKGFILSEIIDFDNTLTSNQEKTSKEVKEVQKQEIEHFTKVLCGQWQVKEEREQILLDLASNYESQDLIKNLNAQSAGRKQIETLAQNSIQARRFIKFLEVISYFMFLHIKNFTLQANLFAIHNTSQKITKLSNTIKNMILLRYDKSKLNLFFGQSYEKQRNLLDATIRTVESIKIEQGLEFKNEITQVKRKRTLYYNGLISEIANNKSKTHINTQEQKRLTSYDNQIARLESDAQTFEINELSNLVYYRLGNDAKNIKQKDVLTLIESVFTNEITRGKERETLILIGKVKSFEQGLLESGFNEIEATEYLVSLDAEIAKEIDLFNSQQSTLKTALTAQKPTKSGAVCLSSLPNFSLYIKRNKKLGKSDKQIEEFFLTERGNAPF